MTLSNGSSESHGARPYQTTVNERFGIRCICGSNIAQGDTFTYVENNMQRTLEIETMSHAWKAYRIHWREAMEGKTVGV